MLRENEVPWEGVCKEQGLMGQGHGECWAHGSLGVRWHNPCLQSALQQLWHSAFRCLTCLFRCAWGYQWVTVRLKTCKQQSPVVTAMVREQNSSPLTSQGCKEGPHKMLSFTPRDPGFLTTKASGQEGLWSLSGGRKLKSPPWLWNKYIW
jgi:hypothetical protein